ncbi:helix-turn-helix transcriptional regulator [Acinetobacter sp. GXMZU3951]
MERKTAPHERLAERLASILTKLNNGQKLNAKTLAQEFSVSPRTIVRDFDRLSIHLPLIHDPVSKQYYLKQHDLSRIRPQDVQNFAELSGIGELFPSLEPPFLKELLGDNAQKIYMAKGYSFEDSTQFIALFECFSKAIQAQREVEFYYRQEYRLVQPYRLIHHFGSWYLAAVHDNKLKAFRLGRIQLRSQSAELAVFKHKPEILQQLEQEQSIWFGEETQVVHLLVDAEAASFFKFKKQFPQQTILKEMENGDLYLSISITHPMQLLPFVRYWIPYVQILAPEHLKQKFFLELKSYMQQQPDHSYIGNQYIL